jgi:hypothetical protein
MMSEIKRKRLTPKPIEAKCYHVMIGVRMPHMVDNVTGDRTAPKDIVISLLFKDYPTVGAITAAIDVDPFVTGIEHYPVFYEVLSFGLSNWGIPVLPLTQIHNSRVQSIKTSWVANVMSRTGDPKLHSGFGEELGFISVSEKIIN